MVKHSQTICRLTADELFECVWPFCGVGTYRANAKTFSSSISVWWKFYYGREGYHKTFRGATKMCDVFFIFLTTAWLLVLRWKMNIREPWMMQWFMWKTSWICWITNSYSHKFFTQEIEDVFQNKWSSHRGYSVK